MSDYVPGRYTGFKNFVYWMATKRHNWLVGVFVLVYWLATAVAVGVAFVNRGAHSMLPWAIGLCAFGSMFVVVVVLVGLSLYWSFPVVPERNRDQSP